MKRASMGFICLLSVFAALFFAGCDNNQGTVDPVEGTITITVQGDEKVYFSLTTGEKVAGDSIHTSNWDIGFQRPRTIVTNSGTTAATLNSNGKAQVWHTEKTDFDDVVLADAVKTGNLSPYFADTSKWFYSMSTNQNITYNVINFTGYSSGAGTEDDPFKTAQYNQKQFYTRGDGTSSYPVTNVVYIVQHGDGVHFSKIQVSSYEYGSSASDTYVVKYKNL
jgi:hypothetical protein